MKNILPVLILFILILLLSGCKKADTEVFLRVQNDNPDLFEEVIVNTSGGEHNYGDIEANSYSDYHSFEYAYNYAYIQLKIDGKEFFLIPNDYVGEAQLKSGYYTYILRVISYDQGGLSLEIKKD